MNKNHRLTVGILFLSFFFLSLYAIPSASASFDRDLYFGLTNDQDVTALQQILKTEGCFTAAVSGNFDEATRAGVICFQTKYNFTSVPASGYVGAYTRSVLNQRSASTSQSSTAVTANSSTSTTVTTTTATSSLYPAGCISDAGFSAVTGKSCSQKTYSSADFSFKYPDSEFTLVPVNYTYSPDYEEYVGVKLIPADLNGRFYPTCDYSNQTSLCGSGPESGIEFVIINHSTVEQVSRLNPANKINTTLVGRPAVKYFFDAVTQGVAYFHIQLDANTALMIKKIYKQTPELVRFPSDDSFEQVLSTFILNPKYSAESAPQTAYPAGCTSSSGYSAVTGTPCAAVYPDGCSSTTAFSATTGKSCSAIYLPGCTSTAGFSATTGISCSPTTRTYTIELIVIPEGCTSTSGFSATTGKACDGASGTTATTSTNTTTTTSTTTTSQPTYPAGCTSASGFSATTGMSCSDTAALKTYSNENLSFKYPEDEFTLISSNRFFQDDYEYHPGVKLVSPYSYHHKTKAQCPYEWNDDKSYCTTDVGIEFAVIEGWDSETFSMSRFSQSQISKVTVLGRPSIKYSYSSATYGGDYYHIPMGNNKTLSLVLTWDQSSAYGRYPTEDSFNQILSTVVIK